MHHVGVEPTSSFEHQGLSLTCLPISPMTQILKYEDYQPVMSYFNFQD